METVRQAITGKNFMRSLIGIISLLTGFALIFCIMFISIPPENKEIKVQVLTFAIGLVVLVTGYYFTTSQGSSDKTDIINKQS